MRVHNVTDPVYAPNSYGGPLADPELTDDGGSWYADGDMVRTAYTLRPEDDDWGQAGTMVREVLDDAARERLVANIVGHLLNGVTEPVLLRAFEYWRNVDKSLGDRIEHGVRGKQGEKDPKAARAGQPRPGGDRPDGLRPARPPLERARPRTGGRHGGLLVDRSPAATARCATRDKVARAGVGGRGSAGATRRARAARAAVLARPRRRRPCAAPCDDRPVPGDGARRLEAGDARLDRGGARAAVDEQGRRPTAVTHGGARGRRRCRRPAS